MKQQSAIPPVLGEPTFSGGSNCNERAAIGKRTLIKGDE